MELRNIPFEQSLTLTIKNQVIEVTVFKTQDAGNIKIGINAPPSVNIDREEIYLKKKQIKADNG